MEKIMRIFKNKDPRWECDLGKIQRIKVRACELIKRQKEKREENKRNKKSLNKYQGSRGNGN